MSNAQAYEAAPISAPSLNNLKAIVGDDIARVDQVILQNVQQDVPLIHDIAQHIISSGGKRLRPALTIACALLCGYQGDRHVNLAAAVELIHTATLLHDDVVDESTLRRGDQTANAIWSNQASVLVGDFLLSRAFQLMVSDGSLEVLRILSDASATISQGEVLQMTTANDPTTPEERYLKVIASKTAALFEAACQLGAVIMDKPEWQKPLADFGLYLGMAFQLVDDALDYDADQATLGKTVGDDFREGKITLPVIMAYAQADEEEKRFWHRTLEEEHIQDGDLEQALALIARYDTIQATIARAGDYCDKAREALTAFPDSPVKAALDETLEFCLYRAS